MSKRGFGSVPAVRTGLRACVPGWTPQLESSIGPGPKRTFGPGLAILFTGLPAAGKTSIAHEFGMRLTSVGYPVTLLDGDELRTRISPDLGFCRQDREANLRRAGVIASEIVKHGGIVLCSFIAPYEESRKEIRETVHQHGKFFLVHLCTPTEECERRDPKGLYRKARAGLISRFTGISDVYQVPINPDVALDTTGLSVAESADKIGRLLASKGLPACLSLAIVSHAACLGGTQQAVRGQSIVRNQVRHARIFQSVLQATAERRVSVTEVARQVGADRHTIEKVVRATTGQSFRQLQRNLLLARAQDLLNQGKPIKEVAFDLGFGHPQSFHRFVRNSSGTTPSLLSMRTG